MLDRYVGLQNVFGVVKLRAEVCEKELLETRQRVEQLMKKSNERIDEKHAYVKIKFSARER